MSAPVVGRISSVVQRDAVGSGAPGPALEGVGSQLDAARGGGSPLDAETRSFMEPRFGQDFSQVRVHTDSRAGQMADTLQARAFTQGSNIFMGKGQSGPSSTEGRRLLAHELTHVVQQGGAGGAVQAKPIIQRDTLPGAQDVSASGAPPAASSAPTAAAPAAVDRAAASAFLKRYADAFARLGGEHEGPRVTLADVNAVLDSLQGEASALGEPRLEQLLRVTRQEMASIFSTPPIPLEVALSGAEAAKLRAYAKAMKHEGKMRESAAEYRDLKSKLKGEKWSDLTGTRGAMAGKLTSAKMHQRKAKTYRSELESLFDTDSVDINVVEHLVRDLGGRVMARHPAIGALHSTLKADYGASGNPSFNIVIKTHVAAEVIESFERISGRKLRGISG